MKTQTLIILMVVFWSIATQQNVTNSSNTTTLSLNKNISVVLEPEKTYRYQTILPAQIPSNQDFFFVVQWPSSDPLQYPFIDITYGLGNFLTCYNSNNQFSGVCSIPYSSLRPNATITAQIYCFVQCKLTITPSLQKRLRMSLADMYKFTAPATSAMPVEIEIPVPYDINYTQIAIYAQIESMNKATQGLEMYANIGDQNTPIPTKSSYDQAGQSIYWGGKGIFLSKEDVEPGKFIKLYIVISQGMTVKIYGTYLYGNTFVIQLGKTYYDYTSYHESKLYLLDLRKSTNATGKTITLGFVVYSGSPFIKIAMDSGFLNTLPQESSTSTTTYLITEGMRAKYNYSGIIYIKVESSWSSNYLLYTGTDQKNYAHIFPDIQLYNELQPKDVYNYFFDDLITPTNATNSTMRSYSIRVDMLKGHVTFGVRRCKSVEDGNSLLNCVINSTDAVKNSTVKATFQEIDLTMKQSEHYYYMSFKYDALSCSKIDVASNDTRLYCSFHIVALQNDNITSDYTITLNKRQYTSTLIEGALSRDFIYKDQYLFFKFVLGSLEQVVSVTFFSTVIEGDIYLLASTQDQFPTMDIQSSKIQFSAGSTLTLSKDKLAKTIYVSTYGIELSEFTLGVKVTRQAKNTTNTTHTTNNTTGNLTNQTSQTKLTLKLDLSQEYVLQEVDTSVTFLISTPQKMNITVQVMQLAGSVNLQIQDNLNKTVTYIDKKITNNKLAYTFQAAAKAVYSALVTANKGDTQKFIILYHKQDVCISYGLNLPLYLSLKQGEKNCVRYTITKMVQLEVTASIPLQNLIDQSLKMVVCINNSCLPPLTSHHAKISKNQLNSYCNFTKTNNSNVVQSCLIQLTFASNTSIDFQVIVEEQGKDIGLFDGIVEKVNTFDLSKEKGKYFYYEIYDWSAIKIFFTSLTSNSYYVALKFVEESSFLNNSSSIYLPFRQTNYDLKQKFETNFFETIVYGSNTNIFTISSAVVDKYCDECFLTISVYPLYTFQHNLAYFEIEVTQKQTVLFLGSSRLGYLQADEIYNYQLQATQNEDAILSIKDLSRQSNRQKDCFSATITQDGKSPCRVENGISYIKKGSKATNLYVQAITEYCNYEVTYTRLDFPLIIASSNQLYQFNKEAAGKLFMIYAHTSAVSFKITQIINTGTLNVYATPITANKTISKLILSDLQTFAFVNVDKNGQFLVSNTSSMFCSNCQYLIVIETQSAVNSQIIISNINSSIPLSVNGIIKEKVIVSELSIRNYTFNSVSAFNITISPIYGKIKVIIIDPTKKQLINLDISTTQVFAIPHNKQTEDFSFDFNSYYTRYSINIEALSDSSYTIKASKQTLTSRLFEGIPFYYTFTANETITLEFLNLNTANASSNSLNLLVDLVEKKTNITPNANVSALFQSKEGENPTKIPITSLTQSDSVYNIEIPLKVGTYYIQLHLDQPAKASIILAKQSLIHLRPSSNAIMFKQGVFQLYSSTKSAMIEIFTCWGDIKVDASSYYKDFEKKEQQYGQIILQQNNYGGHYVINAEYIYGEYFIKVSNRQKHQTQMGYLITYYYYDKKDVLPYKVIDMVSREISYTLTKTQVKFTFNPVTINWDISDSIDSVFVEYRIYISDNKNKVSKYANCRLGDIYWGFAEEKTGVVSVSLDIDKIGEIVNNQDIYFVGAEAIVFIEPSESADENYPEQLNLIYETIELTNVRMPVSPQQTGTSYSVQMIIVWFLLPFAIAGVILYFALKYCIRKYRGLVPNELMEEAEGYGQSNQGVNLPDRSPYGENPNNASQSMKQQV